MKKLLFIIPDHFHGGTNKSLQNILLEVDKQEYDIRVYSIFDGGVYKNIFKSYAVARGLWVSLFFSHPLISIIVRKISPVICEKFLAAIFRKEAMRVRAKESPDIIVPFEEGLSTLFGHYFTDVYKIAWVQCDYAQYVKSLRDNNIAKKEENIYKSFDRIVCVSKATMLSMASVFPNLCDKITFSYNMLDVENTKLLSEEIINDSKFDTSVFSILSIGRFVSIKRFDRIPCIVESILQRNPHNSFKWYIIAPEGGDEKKTRDLISKRHLEDFVVFLGAKANPYPYIKEANLVVCLSKSESWSYVINEAKLLHTPVVTTNFEAAFEVVDNSVGIISSIEEMADILFELIEDKSGMYSSLTETTSRYNYSNSVALEQFNHIMEI